MADMDWTDLAQDRDMWQAIAINNCCLSVHTMGTVRT